MFVKVQKNAVTMTREKNFNFDDALQQYKSNIMGNNDNNTIQE